MRLRLFLLGAALCTLAACDSGGAAAPARGSFEARLTGAVEATLTGDAAFTRESRGGFEALSVTFVIRGGGLRGLGLSDFSGAVTGPGTYPLGEVGERVSLLYFELGAGGRSLGSTDGELTVTRLDDERMEARFEATLADGLGASGERAEITGSFEAVPFPVAP